MAREFAELGWVPLRVRERLAEIAAVEGRGTRGQLLHFDEVSRCWQWLALRLHLRLANLPGGMRHARRLCHFDSRWVRRFLS